MHGRSIVHVIYSEFFHLIQSRIKFAALLLIRIGSIRTFKFVNGYSTSRIPVKFYALRLAAVDQP